MSAMKQGTPKSLNDSANTWRETVFPVPVAPAMRPCLFAIFGSMWSGWSECAIYKRFSLSNIVSKLLHFSWQDRQNLVQMWSDFHELCPVSCFNDEEFMIWALAVMENYMKITRTFLLDVAAYAEKINIVERCIRERESIIHEKLHLIPYDPRYISEDALINMVFS